MYAAANVVKRGGRVVFLVQRCEQLGKGNIRLQGGVFAGRSDRSFGRHKALSKLVLACLHTDPCTARRAMVIDLDPVALALLDL